MKTRQQELELIAEWLHGEFAKQMIESGWNPSPEGNDTDFNHMVAGRVDFSNTSHGVEAKMMNSRLPWYEPYSAHNNSEYLAMKHAAYQVCLMAAGEES